jgi:hypothetical protein
MDTGVYCSNPGRRQKAMTVSSSTSSPSSSNKTSSTSSSSTASQSESVKTKEVSTSKTGATPSTVAQFKDGFEDPKAAAKVALNVPDAPAETKLDARSGAGAKELTIPSVDLKLGDQNVSVSNLQECLKELGHLTQEQIDASPGVFDTATQDAVKAFQTEKGIKPVSGYFGPLTRAAMRTALDIPAPLGTLSQKYESSGNPGAVSGGVGDPGGVSYGAYQFATNAGSPQAFVDSLKDTHPDYYESLKGKTPGTEEFSTAWKEVAAADPDGFLKAQHDYVASQYYEPAKESVGTALGIDFSTRSRALNDVLWSTSVQHGTGGALDVFQDALAGQDVSKMTDEEIIRAVYAERGRKDENGTLVRFSSSSADVQASVAQRFVDELADALAALAAENAK